MPIQEHDSPNANQISFVRQVIAAQNERRKEHPVDQITGIHELRYNAKIDVIIRSFLSRESDVVLNHFLNTASFKDRIYIITKFRKCTDNLLPKHSFTNLGVKKH